MKLQFKVQQYQTDAVNPVVDAFAGQPRSSGVQYRIDPGRPSAPRAMRDDGTYVPIASGGQGELVLDGVQSKLAEPDRADSGLRNAEIALSADQLLENIRTVQRERGLTPATKLATSKAAPGVPNLDIEMETGTGKTYVYIKTMMELHRRYGWSKFIVVVPSIAIREGVMKTFQVTADHFQQEYGTKPRAFIYNSKQLHEVERFSSDAGVQVMIINIQAFNATGADQRRIYDELDDFQSRKPIDVIAANRPIVIIDEPQKIGAEKSLEALSRFHALMVLRYSATHKVEHTKVHRLDALDAYNQKLVKKIAVRGITVKGLAGTTAYLYLDHIEVSKGHDPRAVIELEVQTGSGIKRLTRKVDKGTWLHDLSGGLEAYKDLVVTDIDANRDVMELSNGDEIIAGQLADRDVTEDKKRRIQIREVIRAHLDKERELFSQGIKVLSLFFIDEVAKYRDYSPDDTLGDYARVFEEEYDSLREEVLGELALDQATEAYQNYLRRDDTRRVHEGYFSIDKKTNHLVDGKVSGRGDDKGQSTDIDAYDLILKDQERLLSFEEPVRFIFSHSALREGWDNPNVFTMGMLKKSDNTISRRQEIGRGLRLSVDQRGERMDNPSTVHDVNELTVVTDESYTTFVDGLQKEIADSLTARPRKATPQYFAGRVVENTETGEQVTITEDMAAQLVHWLTVNGFIDYQQQLTDKWDERATVDMPPMPAGLDATHYQVADLIDGLRVGGIPDPVNGRKPKVIPLNQANFDKKEFQALWQKINHKAIYQVDFDSEELIAKAVAELDKSLKVATMQYVVQAGEQVNQLGADDLKDGTGFELKATTTSNETVSAGSQVKYDLLGEIAEKTQLTRRTVAEILQKVRPTTFGLFKVNPEQFITEASRIINEQKATTIIEHLEYHPIDDQFESSIFTENQTKQDLTNAGSKLNKHIYDYVVTDSKIERDFVNDLDTSAEVAVYAKLPRGFFIPTPVGNYNPDWAVAFQEGKVKHVYFVAETKGSLSSMKLRPEEQAKIDSAKKFFAKLNDLNNADVTYDVATSYTDLMQKVMG